jgi:hypothetical protein
MYTYAKVEAVLAKAFGIRTEGMGAFRGRIKHFKKLGISPSTPCKGRKIAYETKDILRWAICLELAEFGFDPTIIKPILSIAWGVTENVLMESPDKPIWLVFYPFLMSIPGEPALDNPKLSCEVIKDLAEYAAFLGDGSQRYSNVRRIGIISISRLRSVIHECLGAPTELAL